MLPLDPIQRQRRLDNRCLDCGKKLRARRNSNEYRCTPCQGEYSKKKLKEYELARVDKKRLYNRDRLDAQRYEGWLQQVSERLAIPVEELTEMHLRIAEKYIPRPKSIVPRRIHERLTS